MKKIILASASERRSQILSDCGIPHEVVPSNAEEDAAGNKHISEIVQVNASKKAETVAAKKTRNVVIGADTLVLRGNEIIGKPDDARAAKDMLGKFSRKQIEVYTGLCVIDTVSNKRAVGFEKSVLHAVKMTEERIEKIFPLLAPYDKAGGFSIEGAGALLFDNISGSYFNILGLPMIKLSELFGQINLDLLDWML
ncbi:MAG: nucleoside triphosphate pyrophosphatase [Candidatus Omnitrophota bacterium]